jgi:tRNA A37 threonylcarbamoyladenosine biosynthesis protein TsaE
VCLIEWADIIADLIPENAVWIDIEIIGDKRHVNIGG